MNANQVYSLPGSVSGLTSPFRILKEAIEDGYAVTRRQIREEGYDDRITLTLFPQLLAHNVMNQAFQFGSSRPEIVSDLVPNAGQGSYHFRIETADVVITVSSIRHPLDRPRFAWFRYNYEGLQGRLIENADGVLVPAPPLASEESSQVYLQVLHGPQVGDRHKLGFIMVAFPDRNGGYKVPPKPLSSYLISPVEEEQVEDDLHLQPHGLEQYSAQTQE